MGSAAPASAPEPPAAQTHDLTSLLWTRSLTREHGFEPLHVEGTLPADLRGTLFRNGPGLFELFGRRYGHPFEADGAITAIHLDGAAARGAVRVTESAELAEERAAGRMLYGFSAPWLGRAIARRLDRRKNAANTSVLIWQDRLFALLESAIPTEIDPRDLTTLGATDLGGVISSCFSAHPHRVASRRTTYNFGLEFSRNTRLHLYALPDEGAARHLGAVDLPGPPMLHDFIATETHLVFFVSPVRAKVPRALLQAGSFAGLFEWRPELGTEILCVPIDRPAEVMRFTVDTFYQWHFANAFTRGRELVIDYVRYPDFASFHELGAMGDTPRPGCTLAALHRATIDLDRKTFRSEALFESTCEFPRVAPAVEGLEHRYTWLMLGNFSGVARLDLVTGSLSSHVLPASQRASEPVFVPRGVPRGCGPRGDAGGESDGHVLVLCTDGPSARSFLAIYDAAHVDEGPRARVYFDHRIPVTYHGSWLPAAPQRA